MAERDDGPGHKRAPQQPRSPPNRLYNSLGVKDLREVLNKKRGQRIDETTPPPPDPSYNYLKDPLREPAEEAASKPTNPSSPNPGQPQQRGGNRRGRGRRGGRNPQDIERPPNIKIEFSTSTGEHFYSLDENKTLPTIKHVPDRDERGRGGRGRGRGGSAPRRYQTRTIRNQSNWGRNQGGLSSENWNGDSGENSERGGGAAQRSNDDLGEEINEVVDGITESLAGTKISSEEIATLEPQKEEETKLN